jgi:hypothetical protein
VNSLLSEFLEDVKKEFDKPMVTVTQDGSVYGNYPHIKVPWVKILGDSLCVWLHEKHPELEKGKDKNSIGMIYLKATLSKDQTE